MNNALEVAPRTLSVMHTLTAPTARYTHQPEHVAWSVLRSGLIEEAGEVLLGYRLPMMSWGDVVRYREHYGETIDPAMISKAEFEGEIGDVLYYVSEISRYGSADSGDVLQGYDSLSALQAAKPQLKTPIFGSDSTELHLENDKDVRMVFGMSVLRVVDILRPDTPELWHLVEQSPSLGVALGDVVASCAAIATRGHVTLDDAFWHVIEKLQTRARLPHVLQQVQEKAQSINSRRYLFAQQLPWVKQLLEAKFKQWEPNAEFRPLL